MNDDPLAFPPAVDIGEERGEFPEHPPITADHPYTLSGPDALADAREHLADWVKANADAQPEPVVPDGY
jgi:hypothetical protein